MSAGYVNAEMVAMIEAGFAAVTEYDARERVLSHMGFEEIGSGSFKVAWKLESAGIVVKLIYNNSGANEVLNYQTAPAHIKPHLLPILAHGRGYQVQEYADRCQCPPDCTGYVEGMHDSDTRNHTHRPDGTLVVWDYGQNTQWEPSAGCEDDIFESEPEPEPDTSPDTSPCDTPMESVEPEPEPEPEHILTATVHMPADGPVRVRILHNAEAGKDGN